MSLRLLCVLVFSQICDFWTKFTRIEWTRWPVQWLLIYMWWHPECLPLNRSAVEMNNQNALILLYMNSSLSLHVLISTSNTLRVDGIIKDASYLQILFQLFNCVNKVLWNVLTMSVFIYVRCQCSFRLTYYACTQLNGLDAYYAYGGCWTRS